MELGEKLRQARLEAGLSQRQLCGERMTRNMLSLIENGSARPSMDTLRFLAAGLGKPVSFFLEEESLTSPNTACMALGRRLWAEGDSAGVLKALEDYRAPDETFDQEQLLLRWLALLDCADRAIREDRLPYAQTLLGQAAQLRGIYLGPALAEHFRLLLARAGQTVPPGSDEGLLLRARQVLEQGDAARALEILPAAEDHNAPLWQLLWGRAQYARGQYAQAATSLAAAESRYPEQTVPLLELCYKALGDYQKAYEYACKGRK